MPQPLSGIKVLALEQAVSLPLATRYMADLGAEVIKIERPDGGDFARGYDSHVMGQSTYFVWLNRGKRSLTLNLKDQRSRDIALQLAADADVFVQNLGPGVAERLGLGADDLRAQNDRLIYCGLTGYGKTGPYADRKAYDLLLQAESGLTATSGTPDQPAKVGISAVDISGGIYVLIGVLTALFERESTGVGKVADVSLIDTIGEWMQVPYLYTTHTGNPFPRAGMRHNMILPYGPYRCGEDGSINLAIQNNREWARFSEQVLDDGSLIEDARFAGNQDRVANADALADVIESRFRDLGIDQVRTRLEAAGIPFGEVREVSDAANHPQFAARSRWMDADSPGGPIRLLRFPIEAEGWEGSEARIPALGEHTDAILREIGLEDDAIADLHSNGAV